MASTAATKAASTPSIKWVARSINNVNGTESIQRRLVVVAILFCGDCKRSLVSGDRHVAIPQKIIILADGQLITAGQRLTVVETEHDDRAASYYG